MRRTVHQSILLAILAIGPAGLFPSPSLAGLRSLPPRVVMSLDGTWQVAEGSLDDRPAAFDHTAPVPGLLDMASPAFAEVGVKSERRQAFWYRRTFRLDGPVPDVATLKLNKARYGTKVWLNGTLIGEHLPCFTPAHLDARQALKGDGADNELIVRVGADRSVLPEGQPSGWDFEKYRFIPGIYDSVALVLTGRPSIVNIQVAPDLEGKSARIVAEVEGLPPGGEVGADGIPVTTVPVAIEVVEAKGGRVVGSVLGRAWADAPGLVEKVDVSIPMGDFRAWSPADPFLYEARVRTPADAATARFGMRSFRFDPASKKAMLNGRPYPLLGTNVCVYRFFEDQARGDRPWRADWVRRLHTQFRDVMGWEAIRYCIGFPPEFWYDIADEEGFLIQDEFPIWTLSDDANQEKLQASRIVPEYTEWMRERWNHPCVVIWDAQNESHIQASGEALRAVRALDLSDRPWENGWAEPQSDADCTEAHPYLFMRAWNPNPNGKAGKPFKLSELAAHDGDTKLQPAQKKRDVAVIINEYDWLWLDREGRPTCLTEEVFASLVGRDATPETRRVARARNVAALTEFWRSRSQIAGILHFCGLGYSRPGDKPRPEGGATSDDFIDLEALTFEPNFVEHVAPAFNPLGLSLDFWAETARSNAKIDMKVIVVNDRDEPFSGAVSVRVTRLGALPGTPAVATADVAAMARGEVTIEVPMPETPGPATVEASLLDPANGRTIISRRDVKIVTD
jgi:hypothetical protein